jgi:molybdopterin converting factor small subunit
MSSGGTFESFDLGRHWKPLNRGVAAPVPTPSPDYGHDPHCMILHPADPDRLYQQNHCGIYRLDRARTDTWERIGRNMPRAVGDIGFPIVAHPSDPDTVWVFPMDGTQLWPRTSPGGKPAVYRTRDGGRRWERLDGGLPRRELLLDRVPPGDGRRRGRAAHRALLRDDVRRGVGQPRRRRELARVAEHLPRILSLRVHVIVHVGSVLHAYTGGKSEVEASGRTVRAVLADLERRFPGLRFRVIDEQERIRTHMRIYVGNRPVSDLASAVKAEDELHILGALSGG